MSNSSLPVQALWRQTLLLYTFDRWSWIRRRWYFFFVSLAVSLVNFYVAEPQFLALRTVANNKNYSSLHFTDFIGLILIGFFNYISSVGFFYIYLVDFLRMGRSNYDSTLSLSRFFYGLGLRLVSWVIIIVPSIAALCYVMSRDNSIIVQALNSESNQTKDFDLSQLGILVFGLAASFYVWLRFILIWPCVISSYKPVFWSSWRLTAGRFQPILSQALRLLLIALAVYFVFTFMTLYLFGLNDTGTETKNPLNEILVDWGKLVLNVLYTTFLATLFIACTGQKTS